MTTASERLRMISFLGQAAALDPPALLRLEGHTAGRTGHRRIPTKRRSLLPCMETRLRYLYLFNQLTTWILSQVTPQAPQRRCSNTKPAI